MLSDVSTTSLIGYRLCKESQGNNWCSWLTCLIAWVCGVSTKDRKKSKQATGRSRSEKVWINSSPLLENSSFQKEKQKPQKLVFGTSVSSLCMKNRTSITNAQERTLDEWAHNSCLLSNKIIALHFKYLMTWSLKSNWNLYLLINDTLMSGK